MAKDDLSGSVSIWIQQAKEGDEEAAHELWNRYFHRLVGFAHKKMSGMKRRSQDEEDMAICALSSFLHDAQRGRYPDLNDRDGLWPLLATITERKVINQYEKERALKRGGGNVRGESIFVNAGQDDQARGIEGFAAPSAGEDFSEALCAECNDMLTALEDETLQLIARRRLEGFSNEEIASELGCVRRTIERKLERIRGIWERTAEMS